MKLLLERKSLTLKTLCLMSTAALLIACGGDENPGTKDLGNNAGMDAGMGPPPPPPPPGPPPPPPPGPPPPPPPPGPPPPPPPPGPPPPPPPGPPPPPPPSDPFNAATAAAEFATSQCQFISRCLPAVHTFNNQDETQCITETTSDLTAGFGNFEALLNAGRMFYTQATFDACKQELASVDCITGLADGGPCDNFLQGVQGQGNPCFFSAECGADLFCQLPSGLGSCGSCAPVAGNQQQCNAAPCGDNLGCVDVGMAAPICVPTNAQLGGNCLTIDTGFCQGRLNCIGDGMTAGTCVEPLGMGATCDPMAIQAGTAAACNINAGFLCDGMACANITFGTMPGAVCSGPTDICQAQFYCDPTAQTCADLPGIGGNCGQNGSNGGCGPDTFCDQAGTCAAQVADGQACQLSAECIGENSACLGAGAAGTCGAFTWMQCN